MGDDVTVVDKLTYAGSLDNLRDVRGAFEFKQLDVCSPHDMSVIFLHRGFDVVINYAAETHVDNSINSAEPFVETNVKGGLNLMELAHHYKSLYVQVSTDEVYGDATFMSGPFTVDDPLRPRNPYSATKAAADMMLLARHNTFKQEYLIFRPSNNFGPRQHKEKFLPKLIDCMLKGKDFPLYGDGKQKREWTYAPDTARAIRNTILSGKRNEIVNVSSGFMEENIGIIQHVKNALEARGKQAADVVKFVADRPGHDRKYWIESTISESEFTPFSDALGETIDHYIKVEHG